MRLTLIAAALGTVVVLAGCQTPPPEVEPVIIEHAKTLDRVHVRDDSALFHEETRGGAAFRQEGESQVLFNDHHMGDGRSVDCDELAAEIEKLQELRQQCNCPKPKCPFAEQNQKIIDAKAVKPDQVGNSAAGKAAKKDRSIYAKDKSVYAKKDKSIYADKKKNTPKPVKQEPYEPVH